MNDAYDNITRNNSDGISPDDTSDDDNAVESEDRSDDRRDVDDTSGDESICSSDDDTSPVEFPDFVDLTTFK